MIVRCHSKHLGLLSERLPFKRFLPAPALWINRHFGHGDRLGVVRPANQSSEDSEPGFQQELLSATRRVQALEAYRQVVQQTPSDIDLFQAALLIAKHRHPLLDEARCHDDLNEQVKAIEASLPSSADQTGFELSYITRQLGQIANFTGNEKDYYDPDNSCMNMVLQRRTGIPITLGLLYMAVAQRMGLSLHGLNLPGHLMVGNSIEGVTNLLVDPFDGFKLLNIPQVEELFAQRYSTKLRLSTALVTNSALVMSTPTMLVRVLLNLKSIYTGLQQADKVLQITDYLRATRDFADDVRDAGLCLFSMQRYTDSAEMLQQYLTQSPYAQDRRQVEAVLSRIYKLMQKPNS
ncbi:TPA: hypothetical protein ACH3X3_001585 [Trebouxia sp. C0006]